VEIAHCLCVVFFKPGLCMRLAGRLDDWLAVEGVRKLGGAGLNPRPFGSHRESFVMRTYCAEMIAAN
jgi:hypothetical protein